jgi:hypothetical protein
MERVGLGMESRLLVNKIKKGNSMDFETAKREVAVMTAKAVPLQSACQIVMNQHKVIGLSGNPYKDAHSFAASLTNHLNTDERNRRRRGSKKVEVAEKNPKYETNYKQILFLVKIILTSQMPDGPKVSALKEIVRSMYDK